MTSTDKITKKLAPDFEMKNKVKVKKMLLDHQIFKKLAP